MLFTKIQIYICHKQCLFLFFSKFWGDIRLKWETSYNHQGWWWIALILPRYNSDINSISICSVTTQQWHYIYGFYREVYIIYMSWFVYIKAVTLKDSFVYFVWCFMNSKWQSPWKLLYIERGFTAWILTITM